MGEGRRRQIDEPVHALVNQRKHVHILTAPMGVGAVAVRHANSQCRGRRDRP
jgi:hypothetical protein